MTIANKTILVTGATGFLGGVITRQLSEAGANVKALARRVDRDRYIKDLARVEVVMGDITNPSQMNSVMANVDIVIHSAAALGGNIEHQRNVNRDGSHNVMQAAIANNITRVVHISTISVYGYLNTGDVTEKTPPAPAHDAYSITKLEAEHAVQETANSTNLEYAIMRPGMIYGPRSTMWTKTMFNISRRNPTIFIGNGAGTAYPIHVEDVARMALMLATHPNANGEIFNCAPHPSPTWRDFLGTYANLTGKNAWFGVPPLLIKPIIHLVAMLSPKHSPQKDLPDLLSFLQRTVTYRTDKARDILGWEPQIDLKTGIQSCVPYLQEKGLLKT